MNIALRQPSMHRLEHWLDHRPDKFERYLVAHPEVADVFERSNPLAGAAETLRATLDAAIAAPLDLAARMRERILEANHETSTAAVVLDLAGLATATLRLLLPSGPLPGDPPSSDSVA